MARFVSGVAAEALYFLRSYDGRPQRCGRPGSRTLLPRPERVQASQNALESEQDLAKRRIPPSTSQEPSSARSDRTRQDDPGRKVRMILVGHSFGALILFNATSSSLIESLVRHDDDGDAQAHTAAAWATLVVLINQLLKRRGTRHFIV